MGRPSAYDPKVHPAWAERLCISGATDADLAREFGVSERTLNRWKERFPEFCQSLKGGKAVADAKVVNALHERACGYRLVIKKTVRKVVQRVVGGKLYDLQELVETETEVFIPPDTTACIFWLKNRDPKRWRDRPADDGGEASQEAIRRFLEATSPSAEEVAALFADEGNGQASGVPS